MFRCDKWAPIAQANGPVLTPTLKGLYNTRKGNSTSLPAQTVCN